MTEVDVDVLIVGGGPVGLAIAYQLLLFSPSTTIHLIEKNPKPLQQRFGRAVTFWCRSMEMLDQIGLAEEIIQQCYSIRTSAAYNQKGEEVFGRGWSFLENVQDTKWDFASVLRQKYVEEIFRGKIEDLLEGGSGGEIKAPAEFKSLEVDETIGIGDKGRVIATVWDEEKKEEYRVKCRYLIGADGSRTAVRGAAGIESDGSRTEDKWVRIDGVLKHTTMPKPRSYGALESQIYGNVLWIPLDHGATRIGYSFHEERQKLYKEMNEEAFIQEAKLSVAPFEIEFERVDWASVYMVGQRVARSFWTKGCVFLAGDACHTHSSGAGQGMNTGLHDAVNLSWKLSLVLTGKAKPSLLETYDSERRPNAVKLIKYDEDISTLVTGKLPKSWSGDPNANPNIVLGQILQEAKGFNTGLSMAYEPNMLNIENAGEKVPNNDDETLTKITIPTPPTPGFRAPDVQLTIPALLEPTRLHKITPNRAKFHIILFAGDPAHTRQPAQHLTEKLKESLLFSSSASKPSPRTQTLTNGIDALAIGSGNIRVLTDNQDLSHLHDRSRPTTSLPLNFLTIFSTHAGSTWDLLGTAPLGKTFWDLDASAHTRYGVDVEKAEYSV
ncbi:putativedichlorophenol 6 [Phaeomoniella chlamydospora]|uniref:Putativedichlorophenol 6 n=1 Tax=Phaeomoniella chlamydospora TaxID=158046 RepID=A0A0G2DV73_PHACM|nr:putativedichlorophenol 6 [Phaeomoniella chlamydospora]